MPILGQALPAHLVGGCGARAVSRKTPISVCLVGYVLIWFGRFGLVWSVWLGRFGLVW